MMKQEFERNLNGAITQEEYDIIETVYMYYPRISATTGKQQVADLYKTFGIRIFRDMLPRAEKAREIEDNIRKCKTEIAKLENEHQNL